MVYIVKIATLAERYIFLTLPAVQILSAAAIAYLAVATRVRNWLTPLGFREVLTSFAATVIPTTCVYCYAAEYFSFPFSGINYRSFLLAFLGTLLIGGPALICSLIEMFMALGILACFESRISVVRWSMKTVAGAFLVCAILPVVILTCYALLMPDLGQRLTE